MKTTDNFDEFELRLINLFENIDYQNKKSNSEWTRIYRNMFADFANKENLDYTENWLWDIILSTNNVQGNLHSIDLIVEIEWNINYHDIKYDFEKLIAGNSKHKVFVFNGKDEDINRHIESLIEIVKGYSGLLKNDRYLLVGIKSFTDWENIYRLYTHE